MVRHSFNANYVWEIPVKASLRGHGPDSLVKGWQVSGTIFDRTGVPYTVFNFQKSGELARRTTISGCSMACLSALWVQGQRAAEARPFRWLRTLASRHKSWPMGQRPIRMRTSYKRVAKLDSIAAHCRAR